MIVSVFDMVENIVGNGENASYQHFLLYPQFFQKLSVSMWSHLRLYGKDLRLYVFKDNKSKLAEWVCIKKPS